ncbi:MAG: accessory factor UbiK family protein [Oceanospirillaceae bacterium]|nr:accessory factor UbiK family protein [Oceanospirillaceae bacterium]
MIDPKIFETISANMAQFMQSKPDFPGQDVMQQQLKSMLQSSFAKLDLVTRDEFDAQAAVLQRTREKLEQLEAQVAALEAKLNAE